MEIINPLAETYITNLSSNNDEQLYNIHQQTMLQHPQQHLQSSWVQGLFLTFLSKQSKPLKILEIGTFTGFSAICLAKGLQPNGELHTIELRETDANTALTNFSICENEKQIHLHLGNALEIIPTLQHKWDLVFIDADKTNYINYYELVLPMLQEDGIIIADNVLFHGQVLEKEIKGKNAIAINNFNEHIANDNRVEQLILSVRDGLMLIKKRKI